MDKLQKWRAALTEAANLSGWDSIAFRPESKLIKRTVEDILLKLNRMSTSALLFPDLVGMAKHVVQIESLLPIDSSNVRNVGIWAMGGIGKTTIAGCVFAKLPSQFERCCFVANVREEVENFGSNHLRDKYLTDLLEQHNLHVGTPSVGSTFVKTRLSRKTVILVFDDVENSSQLEYLLGSGDSYLGLGSRLMVTSRDRQVLVKAADEIYEVPEMSFEESLQLFCLNAFKMDNPVENLRELSNMLVYHCGGNPLALKVLGSCLYNRNKKEWESALKKLNKAPHKEIHNVLKLSYDGLDDEEKAVFLDISCFFNEHESMTNIVGILGESAIISIRVLIDLCLVSFLHASERVDMHDLIKEMSQEIVRQQSITERGKHSRLWCPKDIYHVLKNNMLIS
ncbi:putative Disease resistance protein (TIR-NBS-LRR class) [Quillaja saponaria]|uniref:Disease resistance protein (TIR-NBS-LRR class) n=1 Tax=Quillaja saponaria TaxID=32244 RepID=A0AAD7LQR2_QUISA|nr:putative Disease resistance protein (TIR-NBS-LRR class) [Quillaja saponaria]